MTDLANYGENRDTEERHSGVDQAHPGGRHVMSDVADELRSAEVAFTVEEDYHGQGIANLLLRNLVSIARENGVSCFETEVLPENHTMLTVFSHGGFPMQKEFRGGTVHVTLSMTEEVS